MHAQFLRRLALVTPVPGQHFKYEAPLEFTHGFVVRDAPCVHLGDQVVQLAFHRNLFHDPGLCRAELQVFKAQQLRRRPHPFWLRFPQDDHPAPDPISQFGRSHNRGSVRHRQKFWSETRLPEPRRTGPEGGNYHHRYRHQRAPLYQTEGSTRQSIQPTQPH
jgi:hypothetical protein